MDIEKNVFLLPFAGGSSLTYNQWQLGHFRFHRIDYSGHGFRYQEPAAQSMEGLVNDVIQQIEGVHPARFSLFGHSMGGLLAWLAAQKLEKKPQSLFISACEPPGCLDAGKYGKYQREDLLMQYISDYNRMPEKQRDSKVFRKILLPVIQNDFRVLSEYVYEPAPVLDVPIVVLYSREDTMMRYEVMGEWKDYGRDVRFRELGGDHFYLEEERNRDRILETMNEIMTNEG